MKRCSKCGQEKPYEAFGRANSRPDGLKPWCRDCCKVAKRAWYAANPERCRAEAKRWRLAHLESERARYRARHISDAEREAVYRRHYRELLRTKNRAGRGPQILEKGRPGCSEVKPSRDYARCAANKDGLQNRCRACRKVLDAARDPEKERQRARSFNASERRNELRQVWYAQNKDRIRTQTRVYALAHPEIYQRGRAKHRSIHRHQLLAKARAKYAAEPEKAREYQHEWRARNIEKRRPQEALTASRRRARQRGNGIEPVSAARIIARDGMICHICAKAVTKETLSFDHIIPVSHGGPDAEWNLRVAHRSCNSRRGAGRTPAQPYLPLA